MYVLPNNDEDNETALADFLSAYTRLLNKYGVRYTRYTLEQLLKELDVPLEWKSSHCPAH